MQKKPETFIQIDFIFIIYASLLIFMVLLYLYNMLTNEFFKLNTNINLIVQSCDIIKKEKKAAIFNRIDMIS